MSRSDNLYELPKDLPVPVDDGACDHPAEMHAPSMILMPYNGSAERTDLPLARSSRGLD